MKTATAILVVLAMFVVAGTTSAQDNDKVFKQEIRMEIDNPCCNETVDVVIDAMFIADQDGEWKHISYSGSGTGLSSGTEYTVKIIANMHDNTSEKGATIGHQVLTLRIVATGDSDCSFTLRGVVHLTINPDGTITAEFARVSSDCENETEDIS